MIKNQNVKIWKQSQRLISRPDPNKLTTNYQKYLSKNKKSARFREVKYDSVGSCEIIVPNKISKNDSKNANE